MKAYVLQEIGNIKLQDVGRPDLAGQEALIQVKAVGICGSDIPRIYQSGAHKMPLIPGHEFSGKVVQVGEGVGKGLLFKRVGVFPLIPCRTCSLCREERYEMCRRYSYLGSRRDGGFAEYAAVPAGNLIELPESVSYEEAAMLEPMAVAVHALRRADPAQSDTVAVYGLGTIGLLLVMFLLEKGITKVLAVGNKEVQKRSAWELGLGEKDYCDSRREDVPAWISAQTGGAGADVCFECVGLGETYAQAVNLTAPGGKVCLVGNPRSDMKLDRQTYWKLLRNQLTVTGTWNSSFTGRADDDWNYVLERLKGKRISPAELITHRFSFCDLLEGIHIMRDKSQEYIKIMAEI